MKRKLTTGVIKFLTMLVVIVTCNNAFALDAPVLTASTSGLDVSLSWTSVLDSTSYTLYYAPSPYTGPDTIGSVEMGTSTSFSATLWDGAAYYVAITANNGSIFGESGYSNVVHFELSNENTSLPITGCDSNNLNLCNASNTCSDVNGYWWSDNTCNRVAEPSTFPLSQAMTSFVTRGFSSNFTQTQTGNIACSGYGNRTAAPATTLTTFNVTPTETITAFSAVQTFTSNWTNCTPAYSATTITAYYDVSNYLPLGFNSPGVNYGAYLDEPAYPVIVSIGDTGIIGTAYLYTDSNETTSNGFMNISYVVTAGTGSTATITFISKIYDTHNTLTVTERDDWGITTEGLLTPISVNISYSSGDNITWTYY